MPTLVVGMCVSGELQRTDRIMNEKLDYPSPWEAIEEFADSFAKELQREVIEGHKLWNVNVRPIARRSDSDDVLFLLEDGGCAVVHLTWSGRPETNIPWPDTQFYDSLESWLEKMRT